MTVEGDIPCSICRRFDPTVKDRDIECLPQKNCCDKCWRAQLLAYISSARRGDSRNYDDFSLIVLERMAMGICEAKLQRQKKQ